jgi:adenylate kinase
VEANPDVRGYCFDGFPRTVPQAEALNKLLAEKGQEVSALMALDVDDEEIIKRILLRGKTSSRADDNDESIIRNRIEVYNQETSPVFDYYQPAGKAIKVNGLGTIEDIFDRLCAEVDKLK